MSEITIGPKGQVEFVHPDTGVIENHGLAQDVAVNWPDKADQVREQFFKWLDAKVDASKKQLDETLIIRKKEYDAHVIEQTEKRKQDIVRRAEEKIEQERLAAEQLEAQAEKLLDAMERVKQKRAKK